MESMFEHDRRMNQAKENSQKSGKMDVVAMAFPQPEFNRAVCASVIFRRKKAEAKHL